MPTSPENIVETLASIRKSAVNRAFFLSGLDSPDWIEPMSAEGFFSDPPSAEGSGSRTWPESAYLARMAPIAPRRVARVVQNIPLTDNLAVHADLARAAVHLSADSAATWAAREAVWLSGQPLDGSSGAVAHTLAEALGELVDRLAAAGEVRAAISLARSLLEIRAVPGSAGAGYVRESMPAYRGTLSKRGSAVALATDRASSPALGFDAASVATARSIRCEARLQGHHYRQFVDRHLPTLLKSGGVDVLAMLCDLVERSVASVEPTIGDHFLSRVGIAQDGQGFDDEVLHILVLSVRDASVSLAGSGVPVRRIAAAMDRPGSMVFKRIVLYLAAERRKADPGFAAQLVLCRSNLDDDRLRDEYGGLLGMVFPTLNDVERSLVLGWIDDGPSMSESVFADRGERRRQRLHWQTARLARIREHLNDEWRRRYAAMVEDVGEPEPSRLGASATEWTGPSTRVNADELRGLSPAQVVEYLRKWDSGGSPRSKGREEMASVVFEMAADSPRRFLAEAGAFLGLPASYAGALVRGLRWALEDDHDLDWELALPFLSRIVAQHRGDPDWRAARSECVLLVWTGLRTRDIGMSLRNPVWTFIDSVCDDPDPSPAGDAAPGTGAAAKSFNCVRGQAFHTVVQYARRIYGHEMSRGNGSAFGMDVIPEVRSRLERHLNPEVEPSPAVRAVYGRWFPHFCLLDAEWARSKVDAIFSDRFPHLRDAAWDSYLEYCQVYTQPAALLRGQYATAVQRLAEPEGHASGRTRFAVRLGQHLLLAAGNGAMCPSDDGDIFRAYFLNAAPDDARKAVLEMGRILRNGGSGRHPEAGSYYGQLVDGLLDMLESEGDRMVPLNSLGSWIAADRFEPSRSLRRLRRLVELAGGAEPTFAVTDYLAKLAENHPAGSFRVLAAWADAGGVGPDFAAGRYGSITQILRAALANDSVSDEARTFIDRLAGAGHMQFRALLEADYPSTH